MRISSYFCVALILSAGCAPMQLAQQTDPLAPLDTVTTDQIVIAETKALVSQIASVDLYFNGEFVGNTGDAALLMLPKPEGSVTIRAEGRFASAYAEPAELALPETDGHLFILIEPMLRGPIAIRAVSRVQWEALAK
jgi:hypothetical protein